MATETGDQFDEEGHRQTSAPPAKLDMDADRSGDHPHGANGHLTA